MRSSVGASPDTPQPTAFSRGIAALLLAVGALSLACGTVTSQSSTEGAQLEAVIDTIREALNEAQTSDVPGFPPLKQVTIKLHTEVSRSASGELQLFVLSAGSRFKTDSASTVELDLKPPATRPAETLRPVTLKQALARAIHLAKLGLLRAGAGPSPLVAKSVTIDLKFAVEVEGSAGGGVKLLPLGVEGTGRLSRERVHTIALTFGS